MPVPIHLAILRRLIAAPLVLSAAMVFGYTPHPDLRIPLGTLGFQALTNEFLLNGSSMLTLDFVDNKHLLVTFETRILLKRIPGDPPDDEDRDIRALLLELPSGRILARTDWRTHDRGQYLWNLGQGHFLLRIRDALTTFAPLRNLATNDPFQQRAFLDAVGRHLGALMLTPEANVLTVETKAQSARKPAADDPSQPADDPSHDSDPVRINFYRIDNSADVVHAIYAGAGRARTYGSFPLTDAGYLDVLDQGHNHWAFNFDTFTGQVWELAPFDSTCRPSPAFVSRSEFVAFGCHDTPVPQILGGFNMRGEEMWQQGLFGDYIAPSFAFSPASGRFVFSRILSTTSLTTQPLVPEMITSQTVIVYQAGSGRQILKAECSPVEPAGGNFALSPDGLSFGVVHDGAIEIYKLPALTSKEQNALKLAQSASPKPTELPVHLTGTAASKSDKVVDPPPAQPSTTTASPTAPSAQPAPASTTGPMSTAATPKPQNNSPTQPQPSAASTGASSADQQSNQPRKPPTLYTLPTDPPHNQSQSK